MTSKMMNDTLAKMRAAGRVANYKEKGAIGEKAVFDLMHEYRTTHGGILKRGFTFPYASNRQSKIYLGNIFWSEAEQRYYDITRQYNDEIDILYISNYRIFVIEVKAYHDNTIVITDQWMERQGKKVEKSPLTQAEKHARHLYHQLYELLPNGAPDYISPIVCLVDESTIDDRRSEHMREYLPVRVLDGEFGLMKLVRELDKKLGEYTLDLEAIEGKLNSIERPKET